MKQTETYNEILAELHSALSSQQKPQYCPGTAPDKGARDEDAEERLLEALIRAALNSTEEFDTAESSD